MTSKVQSASANSNGEHPANDLIVGSDDQINNLLKLHPVVLPNESADKKNMDRLRCSYKYVYVINWLYNCRGYVRLQSENFDVDLFEIELLNMVYPPPVDESILFINKLKMSLISTLQGSKMSSLNNFEKIFRLWFGIETHLKGNESEEDSTPEPRFDDLKLEEKIDILYIIINYITSYPQFRSWIDKNGISVEMLRESSLYSEVVSPNRVDDYFLLFECSSLYKRITTYPSVEVPKKRKDTPENVEEYFPEGSFDVEDISFELVYKNVYEYNKLLLELGKNKKKKKNKTLYSKLTRGDVPDTILHGDIKKRRVLTNRRKELQLANLLATRKRSSRLEAKEKQKEEERKLLKQQEEEEFRMAAERRFERRRVLKESPVNAQGHGYDHGLTREQRLKMRKLQSESATPELDSIPHTNATPTEAELDEPKQETPFVQESSGVQNISLYQQSPTPNEALNSDQSPSVDNLYKSVDTRTVAESFVPPQITIAHLNPSLQGHEPKENSEELKLEQ